MASKNNLIQIFDLRGRFYRRITSRWLTNVADITSDDTYFYVADSSGRIIPFKHDLREMAWTVNVSGKIDSLAVCEDYLYVFDPDSQTIRILDKQTGKPVQLIGPNPEGEGNRTVIAVLGDHILTSQNHSSEALGITGMAVDRSEGQLFLSSGDTVYVFDTNYYLGRFAVPECNESTGHVVLGLDIDWQSGNLLVSHGLLGKASGVTILSRKARQELIGGVHPR